MTHPLFTLLTLAYGSAAIVGLLAVQSGAPIWLGILAFWIGGATMVLPISLARVYAVAPERI